MAHRKYEFKSFVRLFASNQLPRSSRRFLRTNVRCLSVRISEVMFRADESQKNDVG